MIVLGLKPTLHSPIGYWGNHDPGACLLVDGDLVAIAEEERFSRNKRATNTFPAKSTKFVLEQGGLRLSDVDTIAVGREPKNYFKNVRNGLLPTSLPELYITKQNLEQTIAGYLDRHTTELRQVLSEVFPSTFTGDFITVSHHRSHAASAAYCSDFDQAVTITVDNRGEAESTVLWDTDLNPVKEFSVKNSIGRFYFRGCQYLGYRHDSDAGKVMGLAPYGDRRDDFAATFDKLVDVGGDHYNVREFCEGGIELLESEFGPRRTPGEEFTKRHKDFAFHLQRKTEEIVTELVEAHVKETGVNRVTLAGGVAMNCKMNREILDLDCVDDLFVQPAANDSGICLGAALEGYRIATGECPDISFTNVYYGPKYENKEIDVIIQSCQLGAQRPDDICKAAAERLADGQLGGWFQGRMEYGARALGNRSILADPRREDSLDRVNQAVKHREPWRPFAPSLLYEARDEYLACGDEAPFMILLDSVEQNKRDEIPAVTHVDGTTRPQTVRESDNERYYKLLKEFERLTGTPVLLNTSFNISGEPIVESPQQAIADFYRTGLDFLAVGDYLLTK